MDLTSPRVIKEIAAQFGFVFKKGLGQNFLTSGTVLQDIVEAAEIEDGVLEIGPGFGVLTAALAEKADKVVALEVDQRLPEILSFTLAGYSNVKVLLQDVLKTDLKALLEEEFGDRRVSVAANLPYYITTPILTRLIEQRLPLKNIVVMVQKEVAQRICAAPGTKDYGAISVLCQYYTVPEVVTVVPAGLFVPPPKVDSAVLKLAVRPEPAVQVADQKIFFRTVKGAFSQRRKTLLNCLVSAFSIPKPELAALLEENGITPTRRGETLSLDEFARLSDALGKRA